jgi:hypothetical protein
MAVDLSSGLRHRHAWRVSVLVIFLMAAACGPVEPSRSLVPPPASPTPSSPPASQLSEDELLALLPRGSLAGLVVDGSGRPAAVGANVEAIGSISNYEPDGGMGWGVGLDGTFLIPRLAAMTWKVSINDLTKERTDPRFVLATATVVVHGGETARVRIVIDRP